METEYAHRRHLQYRMGACHKLARKANVGDTTFSEGLRYDHSEDRNPPLQLPKCRMNLLGTGKVIFIIPFAQSSSHAVFMQYRLHRYST